MSSRRRQAPWIHRNSRLLIAGVAILGALNTAYITATKLFGGQAACPTSGCEQVLSSPYAYVFGIPLSLFGLLAYIAMAAFALVPLAVNPDSQKARRTSLENRTWLLLFMGATAMLVFSGYLMYIMATQFVAVYGAGGICYYCIASALFALALFVLTIVGRDWDDVGQLLFTGVIVAMVTLVGTLGVYAGVGGSAIADTSNAPGQAPPAITTSSGPAEIALAKHLTSVGARMFGAYWCPHCHDQERLFGREAWREVTYVECAPDGKNAQPDVCQAQGIEGYPTWEVNGKKLSGTQTLQQLAEASGYQGPTNFQNGG